MSASRRLVVSVHDVTPPSWSRVERMLDALSRVGVVRRSLLVVPNFQGRWPIDQDEAFCAALSRLRRNGDELVLHGYEHVGVGEPQGAAARFKNRWFTDGEGEFLSLDYAAARDRIERGLAIIWRADLAVNGFVAPAWLINPAALRAVRDCGFEYTTSYFSLSDLPATRSHLAPNLVFGPGRLNEDFGIAIQQRLSGWMSRSRIVRVTLHPPCIDHPHRFNRILSMIDGLLVGRTPTTYLDLLAELRDETEPLEDRRAG
jgi:predicted deacetylase